MHGLLPGMKEFLCSRETGELADLLLSVAENNDQFRERLNQLKRRAEGHAVDLEGFKRNITLACSTPRYIDYKHIGEFADRIERSLEPIELMMKAGEFSDVLPLIDFAITSVNSAFENCDDDGCHVSSIHELLVEQHWKVCQALKPPGSELGLWVFNRERHNHYGLFDDLFSRYSGLMGAEGMDAYEVEVRKAWELLPVIPDMRGRNGERGILVQMTKELAEFVARPELFTMLQEAFVQRQLNSVPEMEREIHSLLPSKRSTETQYAEKLIGEVSHILRSNGYEQSWQDFVERLKTRHPRKMERLNLPT